MFKQKKVYLAVIGGLLSCAVFSAQATTYTVTSTTDNYSTCFGTVCPSLRTAIIAANKSSTNDVIVLEQGTYLLTRKSLDDDNSFAGDLDVINNGKLTIQAQDGLKAPAVVISADATNDGVFDVLNGANLTLSRVTVTGGFKKLEGQEFGNGGGFHVSNATLILDSVIVKDNQGEGCGGGIYATDDSTVTLTNSTVSGNTANGAAGIYAYDTVLTLTNSTVSGNTAVAVQGGGIYAYHASTVRLINSTISENTTAYYGGGIYASDDTTVTLTNSTISENTARYGGGIDASNDTTVTLTNSTISENTADYYGGGISAAQASVTLINSTTSGNTANIGGGISAYDTTVSLKSSVIVNSMYGVRAVSDCELLSDSVITSYGDNWIENAGNCASSQSNDHFGTGTAQDDPQLDLLADNGGPVLTNMPQEGSPLIDAVTDCTDLEGNSVNADARGVARTQGAACDIGAVEVIDYAPIIAITNPIAKQRIAVGTTVSITAEASDIDDINDTIDVEFYVNGKLIGTNATTDADGFSSISWKPTTRGVYVLAAYAIDGAGHVTRSQSVNVVVK